MTNMSLSTDPTQNHATSGDHVHKGDGEVTGVSKTISNAYPCWFQVGHRPANCNLEFNNMGSDLLLGPASDEWDMSTGNRSKGVCCTKDRLSYDENPQLVAIALTKPGICLSKSMLAKRSTLRQLA